MLRYIIPALLSPVLCAQGQVYVDKPLVLDGAAPEQRQVTGLALTTIGSAPITAGVEQSGAHRAATASAGTNWEIELPALSAPPTAGTHIVVQAPASPGAGPVLLNVNTDGPFAVINAPGSPFLAEDATDLPALSLVFDGTAFQVMNGRARRLRDCPTGMMAVSDQYCVDISETDTTGFFEAATSCVAQNKRLCTWGEWFGACNMATALGLQNMTDNWEWTGDSANETNGVRIVGPGCSTAGTWSVINEPQRYRCCLTR